MSNEDLNKPQKDDSWVSRAWDWGSGTFNSFKNQINYISNRHGSSIGLKNFNKKLGSIEEGPGSVVNGGITWAQTGDPKAGITAGISSYLIGRGLKGAFTAEALGGHLKAGGVTTTIGILYSETFYNMLYNIPIHGNDPTWQPEGFLVDTPLLQFENYLFKTDKKAYKALHDLKQRLLREEIRRNNEKINAQIDAWGEKYINPLLKEFNKFEKAFQEFVKEITYNTQITKEQYAEYLKNQFKSSSMTEDQRLEQLRQSIFAGRMTYLQSLGEHILDFGNRTGNLSLRRTLTRRVQYDENPGFPHNLVNYDSANRTCNLQQNEGYYTDYGYEQTGGFISTGIKYNNSAYAKIPNTSDPSYIQAGKLQTYETVPLTYAISDNNYSQNNTSAQNNYRQNDNFSKLDIGPTGQTINSLNAIINSKSPKEAGINTLGFLLSLFRIVIPV